MSKMQRRFIRLLWLGLALLMGGPTYAANVDATLQWARRVELSTPVSGVVAKVYVKGGDRVKANQPLVELDQRGFRAAVKGAEADVKRLGESRDEAHRELERSQQLYDRTLLSEHDLQLAKIANTTAEAKYEAARAVLTQARLDLQYSVVRAPFDALVLARPAQLGQTVVTRLQSVPLVTVVESGRMLAHAQVDEAGLAKLQQGQDVTVESAGHRFEGKVVQLGMEPVAGGTGTPRYAVDVVFSYPVGTILRAGQSATVSLP